MAKFIYTNTERTSAIRAAEIREFIYKHGTGTHITTTDGRTFLVPGDIRSQLIPDDKPVVAKPAPKRRRIIASSSDEEESESEEHDSGDGEDDDGESVDTSEDSESDSDSSGDTGDESSDPVLTKRRRH
jgi:hypothetical protein